MWKWHPEAFESFYAFICSPEFSTLFSTPLTANTHCMWQIGLAWDRPRKVETSWRLRVTLLNHAASVTLSPHILPVEGWEVVSWPGDRKSPKCEEAHVSMCLHEYIYVHKYEQVEGM